MGYQRRPQKRCCQRNFHQEWWQVQGRQSQGCTKEEEEEGREEKEANQEKGWQEKGRQEKGDQKEEGNQEKGKVQEKVNLLSSNSNQSIACRYVNKSSSCFVYF